MSHSYEAWRISYQSDEQAARAAFNAWARRTEECDALVTAAETLGPWMSAALSDPKACAEFKVDAAAFLNALYRLKCK